MVDRKSAKLGKRMVEIISGVIYESDIIEEDAFVAVTRVSISDNLSKADVYVNIAPSEIETQVLNSLNKNVNRFCNEIFNSIKVNKVPKIKFILDKNYFSAPYPSG